MISHGEYNGDNGGHGDVVVGFDGSPAAWCALRWAADEAGHRRVALDVVCCTEDRSVLRELEEAVWVAGHRGLQISVHMSPAEGNPAEALVEHSRGAATLVLGGHDPDATRTAGQESLSAYCRSNAVCPVTVVDVHRLAPIAESVAPAGPGDVDVADVAR